MLNKHIFPVLFLVCATIAVTLFSACFSPVDPDATASDPDACRVTFSITSIEQIPFENTTTTRNVAVKDYCSRLGFAVFQGEEKVKNINQTHDDQDFGTVTLSLAKGTYQVVVIGHNGKGSATISSPSKITFANNKCTDSFYQYFEITVEDDVSHSVSLSRAVAMFRLVITDAMPADVAQMKFVYTGGSSTFDATTGFGCVNSRQTETFDVTSAMLGQPTQFEVYTFPHAQTGELKISVEALSAEGIELYTKEFTGVPVTINQISKYTTTFFDAGDPSSSFAVTIAGDGQWADEVEVGQ